MVWGGCVVCVWGAVCGVLCKGWCVVGVVHAGPCTGDGECTMVSSWAAISCCHQQELCVLLPRAGGLLVLPFQPPQNAMVAPTSSHCHLPMDRIQRGVPWYHRPWPWSWLQNTHLLALEKIVGTKYLGQMKGESIAGIPGLQSHDRSRAGVGAGAAGARGSQAGVRSEGIRHFQRWVRLCQGAAAGEDRNVTAEHPGVCRADQDPAGQARGKTSHVEKRSQPPLGDFQGDLPWQAFHCSLSAPSLRSRQQRQVPGPS